jgi:hypothetical protein
MSPGGGERPAEARVGGIRYLLLSQHEPDADRSLGLGPVGDDIIHRRIGGIDRLHDAKPLGILGIDLERVARVIAVELNVETMIAASTPTADIAATISSPVADAGPCSCPAQGRQGWLRS